MWLAFYSKLNLNVLVVSNLILCSLSLWFFSLLVTNKIDRVLWTIVTPLCTENRTYYFNLIVFWHPLPSLLLSFLFLLIASSCHYSISRLMFFFFKLVCIFMYKRIWDICSSVLFSHKVLSSSFSYFATKDSICFLGLHIWLCIQHSLYIIFLWDLFRQIHILTFVISRAMLLLPLSSTDLLFHSSSCPLLLPPCLLLLFWADQAISSSIFECRGGPIVREVRGLIKQRLNILWHTLTLFLLGTSVLDSKEVSALEARTVMDYHCLPWLKTETQDRGDGLLCVA